MQKHKCAMQSLSPANAPNGLEAVFAVAGVRMLTINPHLRTWPNLDFSKSKEAYPHPRSCQGFILFCLIIKDFFFFFLFGSLLGLGGKFLFRIKVHFFFFFYPLNLEELLRQRITFEVKRNCAIKPGYKTESERGLLMHYGIQCRICPKVMLISALVNENQTSGRIAPYSSESSGL